MEKIEYLPLGSIVLLEGGIKKLVIVSRGVAVNIKEGIKFFDYGGAQYPEGIIGDQIAYFNHEGISKVIFKGYSDEDDKVIVENINKYAEKSRLEKGDPYEINGMKGGDK